jgi:hypothetical protein
MLASMVVKARWWAGRLANSVWYRCYNAANAGLALKKELNASLSGVALYVGCWLSVESYTVN